MAHIDAGLTVVELLRELWKLATYESPNLELDDLDLWRFNVMIH